MNELERLHPAFFPIPAKQGVEGGRHALEALHGLMDKQELLKLYAECGTYLHKGSLKNLLRGKFPTQLNFPEITKRAQRILDLLSVHMVATRGGELIFICVLRNADDNMRVQVAIAEKYELPESLGRSVPREDLPPA